MRPPRWRQLSAGRMHGREIFQRRLECASSCRGSAEDAFTTRGARAAGGRRHGARRSRAGRRRFSRAADHTGGAVRAERRQRHHGPPRRRAHGQGARAADRGREPAGRRRQYRLAPGRAQRARRLHDAAGVHRHHRHQSEPLRQSRLRPGQGPHADRLDRHQPRGAGGASVAAGENAQGADRLRQGQSRPAQLRLVGRRHRGPCRDRDAGGRRRHQGGAGSLQGHRSGRSPTCSADTSR